MILPSSVASASVVALALAATQTASAATYYVATDGSDSNPGDSESQPFLTIRRAIDAATSPGDIVYIRGGTYGGGWENQLRPLYSGTAGSPITFAAYPGELPIIDGSSLGSGSGVEPNEVPVQHVRFEGLVSRNWASSGFSNGWTDSGTSSSNIEFINCIAENNGVNGIAFYDASNVTIQGCIVAHNGAQLPSWSSGVNIYGATGTNIVDGNLSFENVDISSKASDGSGFILDEGSTHGLFVNNIAFRNGGSCIRLTRSSGAELINNTCVLNGQDSSVDYNDEIYVSDVQSADAMLINNVALPSSGRAALGGESVSNASNNVWLAAGAASPFASTENPLDLHPATSSAQLIDQGTSSSAPSDDIGFDPRCITTASGLGQWWQYAPDYAYIESVGGVAGCFRRGARPVGSAVDIGAYESGSAATGCTDDTQCDDGDVCTTDTCQASGQCSNLGVAGCCTADTDCADADDCTIDTCDTATNVCSNAVDPECGQNNSGEWSVDANGYVSVCDWGGYHWGAAGPEEPGVNGTLSSIEETTELCYSGVVAAHDGYRGWALAGVNISQEPGAGTTAENTTPAGDGLNISVTNNGASALRVQIQDAGSANTWCVELDSSGGFFSWSEFNTECWSTATGTAYALEPINVIAIMAAGHNTDDVDFDFCLNQFSPSGTECGVATGGAVATDGAGGTVATDGAGGTVATDGAGGTVATDGAGGTVATDGAGGTVATDGIAGSGATTATGGAVAGATTGAGGATGTAGGSSTTGGPAAAAASPGEPATDEDGGCACSTPHQSTAPRAGWLATLVGALLLGRRRRWGAVRRTVADAVPHGLKRTPARGRAST